MGKVLKIREVGDPIFTKITDEVEKKHNAKLRNN